MGSRHSSERNPVKGFDTNWSRTRRIRLPDAIVWTSARSESAVLVTRNTKDFAKGASGVRVPYSV
jgi:hypothetical protein